MTDYAAATDVSVERSRAALERLLSQHGAGQFMSAFDNDQGKAIVGWTMKGRMIRIQIPLPLQTEKRFRFNLRNGVPIGEALSREKALAKWEQACRTRWRAIVLIVKAKLEAVSIGISSIEREFLADTVMADGQTVGMWLAPQLEAMYSSGRMPALLPGLGETGGPR